MLDRFNEGIGNTDVQCLLQRDGQDSGDAPWVHACGEDDEVFLPSLRRELRGLLLRRDGQRSSDALWVHACGEDDGGYACNVTVIIRRTRRGSTRRITLSRGWRAAPRYESSAPA